MKNIATISDKYFDLHIKPMDYVSNGVDVGRYLGTTKRGVRVVAWGDKSNDFDTVSKLMDYVIKHSN